MPEPLLNEAAFPSSSIRAVRWPEYGDLLVRAGKLTPRDLERALAAQRSWSGWAARESATNFWLAGESCCQAIAATSR